MMSPCLRHVSIVHIIKEELHKMLQTTINWIPDHNLEINFGKTNGFLSEPKEKLKY